MKCINCGIYNNLSDRYISFGRCKSCAHEFVFEPMAGWAKPKMTDLLFYNAISAISANNTLSFTSNQLYYQLNKQVRLYNKIKTNWGTIFLLVLLIFAGLMDSIDKGNFLKSALLPCLLIGVIYLGFKIQQYRNRVYDLIDRALFNTWLTRWNSINNTPEKILSTPDLNNLPAVNNPEVTAYSFDRVVVCDRAEIAQLLISNNFHFEHNCAILTIDGYPHSIFNTTMEMLRRNSELQVYAFHDFSPNGVQIAHRLRTDANWFPNPEIPIIDVCILPRQIMGNRDLLVLESADLAQASRSLSPAIRANFNSTELAWLDAGNYLELESFSTQKLIRILQRAINESRQTAAIDDDNSSSISGDSSFYVVDSFG